MFILLEVVSVFGFQHVLQWFQRHLFAYFSSYILISNIFLKILKSLHSLYDHFIEFIKPLNVYFA